MKIYLKIVCMIILLIFILIQGCTKTENNPITPAPSNTDSLLWSDEFNTSSLDLTKWNIETGTGVNGDWGTGQLDRATERTANISLSNSIANADGGCLVITTQRENYIDRQYTSGRINTSKKVSFGPGTKIEARIWAKDILWKGQGFAFWMMPDEKPSNQSYIMWPQGGEVDIMEYVGSIPFHNLGSVHYAFSWNNNQYADWNHGHQGGYYTYQTQQVPLVNPGYGGYPPSPGDANAGSASFHTYGIKWYVDRMEFYIDSNVYHVHYFNDGFAFDSGKPDGKDYSSIKVLNNRRILYSEYSNHFNEWHPFEHKLYLILSAGVGGNDNKTYGGAIVPNAIFPCKVYIDWIRAYKMK